MLSYLRKIRRSLIKSGQTKTYLLYAMGEIALVVIGILIALQVNNWNLERQAKQFESKLLSELQNSIRSEFGFINFSIRMNEDIQSSCRVILSHLDNDIPYHDSLADHFTNSNIWMSVLIKKHAYENIKSYGLDFIKKPGLKEQITGFYEGMLPFANTMMERQNLYYYNTAVPILTELFEETTTPLVNQEGIIPYNYEELKNDRRYRNILKSNIRNRNAENDWIENMLEELKELEQELENEIKNR